MLRHSLVVLINLIDFMNIYHDKLINLQTINLIDSFADTIFSLYETN